MLTHFEKKYNKNTDHSPPSSAKFKNAWSYTFTPPMRLHGVLLISSQGQLYRYLC